MKAPTPFKHRRDAQTLVMFVIGIGLMFLLCGFAIDSGMLYLAKARISRAVDGAALSAVGNFHQSSDSTTNRDDVALIMRNFAVANYPDLGTVGTSGSVTPGGVQSTYTTTSGTTAYQYTYIFYDANGVTGGSDPAASPPYRRYVEIVLQTGSGGQITSGQCSARCPAHTYFIGIVPAFRDLKVSSAAIAVRNPRLIMVVVDRSASMLYTNGGAFGLPAAITTFLNFFDTSSDYIGLVSFGSAARLEMPLTTNFLEAGTNDLYDSYQIDNDGSAIPGVDPEEYTNYSNFTTNDVRRMKFGGQTAADEGLRLALEELMQNPGYTNPNVVKYIVLFTDGAWNTTRTLLAAPGYTNVFTYPNMSYSSGTPQTITGPVARSDLPSAQYSFPGTPFGDLPMPFLSPWPDYSNSVTYVPSGTLGYNPNGFDAANHANDIWLSADGLNEPLSSASTILGAPKTIVNNANNLASRSTGFLENYGGTDYYTSTVDVWLPPGSVDYVMQGGAVSASYISDYNSPTNTVEVTLTSGQSNVLVVPGYIVDGVITDNLDLPYPDNAANGGTTYPRYREDGYSEPFMWPDETNSQSSTAAVNTYLNTPLVSGSTERALMYRNYANLLTGYYIFRPDDPLGASTDIEPLTGAVRPLNGNGPYYPSAAFYWPFDLVGFDQWPDYALTNAISDPDPTHTGLARFISYSINMLSTNAAPEYAGELFYEGTGGTNVVSGTSAQSTQITSASSWQSGAPSWFQPFISAQVVTNEPSHFPTNIGGTIFRPLTFNGSNNLVSSASSVSPNDGANYTGGYVTDGNGNIYRNTMAYSGRPTHYFDFSKSSWEPIPNNHNTQSIALGLGNWKAQEYAWHARAAGVTIYTVGYGGDVTAGEQVLLAQVANATNSTGATTGLLYNPNQPIGQQFYAATPAAISNDFYLIGTTINGALTQ